MPLRGPIRAANPRRHIVKRLGREGVRPREQAVIARDLQFLIIRRGHEHARVGIVFKHRLLRALRTPTLLP